MEDLWILAWYRDLRRFYKDVLQKDLALPPLRGTDGDTVLECGRTLQRWLVFPGPTVRAEYISLVVEARRYFADDDFECPQKPSV